MRRREDERKEERERETVIAEAQFIYGPSQKLAMTIEPMLSAPRINLLVFTENRSDYLTNDVRYICTVYFRLLEKALEVKSEDLTRRRDLKSVLIVQSTCMHIPRGKRIRKEKFSIPLRREELCTQGRKDGW